MMNTEKEILKLYEKWDCAEISTNDFIKAVSELEQIITVENVNEEEVKAMITQLNRQPKLKGIAEQTPQQVLEIQKAEIEDLDDSDIEVERVKEIVGFRGDL